MGRRRRVVLSGVFLLEKDRSRFSQSGNVRAHQWWMPMDLTFNLASTFSCMVLSPSRDSPDISAHQQELHLNVILTKHRRGSLCGTTISKGTKWARLKMLQRVTSAIICNGTHKTCVQGRAIWSAQRLFSITKPLLMINVALEQLTTIMQAIITQPHRH